MAEYDEHRTGGWGDRVAFAEGGGFAYVPGVVLVRAEFADRAEEILQEAGELVDEGETEEATRGWIRKRIHREAEATSAWESIPPADEGPARWARFDGVRDPLRAIQVLHEEGIASQVDHVLFAVACCPPHPADPCAASFYAGLAPVHRERRSGGKRVSAYPFYANPFYANAFGPAGCCCGGGGAGANPFYANPFYANPFYANPFYANPFYANPFYANPFYANADRSPFAVDWAQAQGRRGSSARPAPEPPDPNRTRLAQPVRVTVVDTGYTHPDFRPAALPDLRWENTGGDTPSEDGDRFLDPAAGHGTFIAGIIHRLAPGSTVDVVEELGTYGEGCETDIAEELRKIAARPEETLPAIVNLSFGGYSPMGMGVLADAIDDLLARDVVVVASAGNDATCLPLYPAAFEEVVAVGALMADEGPAAPFTNYGPWVDACTAGADIVSWFFEWDGAEPPVGGDDPDRFEGWAVWSGTSFAAPRVAAALARQIADGMTPEQAVAAVVRNPSLPRRPMLGTVVVP